MQPFDQIDFLLSVSASPFTASVDKDYAVTSALLDQWMSKMTQGRKEQFFNAWGPSLPLIVSGYTPSTSSSCRQQYYQKVDGSEVGWLQWTPVLLELADRPFSLDIATGEFSDQLGVSARKEELIRSSIFVKDQLTGAFEVLSRVPDAFVWVKHITRGIVAVFGAGDHSASGGSSELPGLYYCDLNVPVLELAETLVHESAHQWYFVGERIVKFVSDDDSSEYYSPFKGKSRPVRTILQTYHAFANVVLFYKSLAGDADIYRLYPQTKKIAQQTKEIEEHLIATPGLSTNGRTFFEILRKKCDGIL